MSVNGMNLFHVSDVYFPRVNGVSTSILGSIRELERRGHIVELLAPRYGGEPIEDRITRVPARPVPFDPEDRLMSRRRALALIEPELDRRPPDLVHVHTPFVAQAVGRRVARRFDAPIVVTVHTHFEDYLHCYLPRLPREPLRRAARAFYRSQARDASAMVVPSLAIRDLLAEYGVTSRVEVIPTGLPIDQFRGGDGAAFRRSLGIALDRKVMVHVGRMAHEKNVVFLLEVLAVVRRFLPDVLLLLAGDGPALPALRSRVLELGLERNVRFVGYLDRGRELLDCYRAGDVFVFASRTETQGLVLLEAMALEVPVVSTAVLGTRDVVGPGRGALVVEEDVAAFAAQALVLLENASMRRRLGAEGRRFVEEEWSDRATMGRMIDLYGELVLERRAPEHRHDRAETAASRMRVEA